MFFIKNQVSTLSSLAAAPLFRDNIKRMDLMPEQTVGHLRIDAPDYINESGELVPFTSENKTDKEIYKMLDGWQDQTVLNAYFSGSLEGGNISAFGAPIKKILVKRLSRDTKYEEHLTVGTIEFDSEKTMVFKDYLIESGEVYLYSIQPVGENDVHGLIQKSTAALNEYSYSWLIDSGGVQIGILDCKTNSISHVNKDTLFETIGSEYPYVNRNSRTNYRTFTLTGTISSEFDIDETLKNKVKESMYGGTYENETEDVNKLIQEKYLEKRGSLDFVQNNDIYENYHFERGFREALVSILKNGKPKIFKGDTEGLVKVKLTNISLSPKQVLGGVLYDFSATATEIGKIVEEDADIFNVLEFEEIVSDLAEED